MVEATMISTIFWDLSLMAVGVCGKKKVGHLASKSNIGPLDTLTNMFMQFLREH